MKKLLLSTVVTLAMIGPVTAGSLVVPDVEVVPPPAAPALKWDGFYAGAYIGSGFDGNVETLGFWAGYNFRTGDMVIGGEADVYNYNNGSDSDGFVKARLGYVFSENVMAYATAGAGQHLTGTANLQLVGLGAEFGVTDAMTIRAEYSLENIAGSPVLSGPTFLRLGAVWNF